MRSSVRSKGITAVFEEFRDELEKHIRSEERVLFPIYDRCAELKSHNPTAKLRSEHRQIQLLLEAIQEKLDNQICEIGCELVVLERLLAQHSGAEELIVYSKIDEVLSPRERGLLVRISAP